LPRALLGLNGITPDTSSIGISQETAQTQLLGIDLQSAHQIFSIARPDNDNAHYKTMFKLQRKCSAPPKKRLPPKKYVLSVFSRLEGLGSKSFLLNFIHKKKSRAMITSKPPLQAAVF